jgi:uncharacterized protein
MPDPIPQAGPVDLGALDAFLLSDRAPEESMGLSDLDGFLTGIAAGPKLILPSEWLPVVWGGSEPTFGSVEEAGSILGIIMGRYNEIVRTLAAAPEDLDPVFWEGPEGQVIVTDWAAGFRDAVWEPLVRHPEAGTLLLPMLLLGADGPDDLPFDDVSLPEVDEEKLHAAGPDLILGCVEGIAAFWKEHGARRPAPPKAPSARPECAQRLSWAADGRLGGDHWLRGLLPVGR